MKRKIFGAAAFLALAGAPAAAGQEGTSAGDFLKIGIGARQAAMGEAAAALADDAAAVYWNPAGLGPLAQQEATFLHTQWFDGIRYEYGAYAHPVKDWGAFAGYFSTLDYGSIDSFSETGAPQGEVSAKDWVLGAGWGSPRWRDRFHAGVGVKWVRESLAGFSAQTFSADLGALATVWESPRTAVRAAAGVRNLFGGLKFVSKSQPLPRVFYLGVAATTRMERLTLALDFSAPRDEDPYPALGAEYWLHPSVAFRAGYRSGREEAGTGFNSGVGLRLGAWRLDYAFSDFGRLGFAHRGAVTLKFGGLEEEIYRKGREWMARGRCAEAILEFNRLLQLNPRHKRAMLRIKECHQKLLREEEALEEP